MKFGRLLNKKKVEGKYYIDYNELKKIVKYIAGFIDLPGNDQQQVGSSTYGNVPSMGGATYRPPDSRFQELIDAELKNVNDFAGLEESIIFVDLRNLNRDTSKFLVNKNENFGSREIDSESQADLIAKLDEVAVKIAHLKEYVSLNYTGFRKITKKYDKIIKNKSQVWIMTSILKEKFMTLDFDRMLLELNGCYAKLFDTEQKNKNHAAMMMPSPPPLPVSMRAKPRKSKFVFFIERQNSINMKTMLCKRMFLEPYFKNRISRRRETVVFDDEKFTDYEEALVSSASLKKVQRDAESPKFTIVEDNVNVMVSPSEIDTCFLPRKPQVRCFYTRTEWRKGPVSVVLDERLRIDSFNNQMNIIRSADEEVFDFPYDIVTVLMNETSEEEIIDNNIVSVLEKHSSCKRCSSSFSKSVHGIAHFFQKEKPSWFFLVYDPIFNKDNDNKNDAEGAGEQSDLMSDSDADNNNKDLNKSSLSVHSTNTAVRMMHEYRSSTAAAEDHHEEQLKMSLKEPLLNKNKDPTCKQHFVKNIFQQGGRVVLPVRDAIVRVEPKTYYANERTFLDWVSFSILIGGVGIGMMHYSSSKYVTTGRVLTILAIYILLNALIQFERRQGLLLRKQATTTYFDVTWGPEVLTFVSILFSFLTIFGQVVDHATGKPWQKL